MRWRWTGQSRAAFERQYLLGNFYLYHSFSVIVAQPLSFTFGGHNNTKGVYNFQEPKCAVLQTDNQLKYMDMGINEDNQENQVIQLQTIQ